MTTPNTTASPPELARFENPHASLLRTLVSDRINSLKHCDAALDAIDALETILDQQQTDLATLQAKLDALVAERELEKYVVDAAGWLSDKVMSESIDDEDVGLELGLLNDAVSALRASRAKGGG